MRFQKVVLGGMVANLEVESSPCPSKRTLQDFSTTLDSVNYRHTEPDPEEIREQCRRVRETWTPAQRVSRRVSELADQTDRDDGFQPPAYESVDTEGDSDE